MSDEQKATSPVFRIDVSSTPASSSARPEAGSGGSSVEQLLSRMIEMQEEQNELLQELVRNSVSGQQQRAKELQQWKSANPRLARACQNAAETLSRVQTQFLETLTEEVADNEEVLEDGEYMLNEFVDRYGPRLAHLNGVLQVVAQLGSGIPAQQS